MDAVQDQPYSLYTVTREGHMVSYEYLLVPDSSLFFYVVREQTVPCTPGKLGQAGGPGSLVAREGRKVGRFVSTLEVHLQYLQVL